MSPRTVIAEAIATAFLLIAVVGSGIMAERLAGGNVALALLANALATGGALFALIVAFGPQSGAHMNPLVTIAAAVVGDLPRRIVPAYIAAQIIGAIVGVWIAHAMFGAPIIETGTHARNGVGQWIAEAVATFGLLAMIDGARKQPIHVIAAVVAAYITGAYWFTASTSFANPAVTIARALTDSFAGIRPADAPGFIAAQAVGFLFALLWKTGIKEAR
jgi:glycerol uptake facilitator-like aquaporin